MSLYRPEAVAAAAPAHFGEVLLAQPARFAWLSFGSLALVLSVMPLLIFGEFSRSETVLGYIAPRDGVSRVLAAQGGTVSAVYVREGERVEKGDAIFEISAELTNEEGDGTLSAQLENLDRRIQEQHLQGELNIQRLHSEIERNKRRVVGARADIARLEMQKSIADEYLHLSEAQWLRWEEAGERGVLADAELELRKQDLLDAELASAELERQIVSRRGELDDLQLTLSTMLIDVSIAESRARSELALLNQSRSELSGAIARKILAPISGRITAIQATVGLAAKAAAPMALILPENDDLHAQLYAPTRTAGFIEPNQPVRIRVDAFPYQRFGTLEGRIAHVSGAVLSPVEVVSPVAVNETVYRLTVDLDAQSIGAYGAFMPLRSGMTVQADLIIDRRPLWRWILDPVLALRG